MKKNISIRIIKNQFIFLSILLIYSCTPMNKITYLNENQERDNEWNIPLFKDSKAGEEIVIRKHKITKNINTESIEKTPPKHILDIGDVLVVKVLSLDETTTNFFNIENNVNSPNTSVTAANIYLNGFTINQNGMIEIPYIGEVYVLHKTIDSAKEAIEKKGAEYFKEATVIVKLGNFNITVLGEINNPNTYPIYKDNISIFEAIALAGDITDYGNLTKEKIIRTEQNKKKVHKIDLTRENIIDSEFYYLKNNDLIYIEPLKYRSFRKSQSQVLLSAITTAAVVINLYLRIND